MQEKEKNMKMNKQTNRISEMEFSGEILMM